MNTDIKKMRILVIVGLSFLFIEFIIGVGTVLSGFMYRGFEKDKMVLQLELIKSNDKGLYDRLMVEQDSLARAGFLEQFQLTRKPLLVTGGLLILFFSIINVIPLGILAYMTIVQMKGEEPVEEEAEPKKEGEEDNLAEF